MNYKRPYNDSFALSDKDQKDSSETWDMDIESETTDTSENSRQEREPLEKLSDERKSKLIING